MEKHELIRRMVLVDGLSEREVARRLGHSRHTVAKALQAAAPQGYSLEKPKPRHKLDPFVPIIKQWLIEDQQRHRKQRHSAVRIFERLRDEHEFTGKRRAVSDVVQQLRTEISHQEVYVPIEHPPGAEVQIDWGEAQIILNGQPTTIMLFCARLAYSKASFVRAYVRQDQPSFLDAHVHLIEFLQGVPKIFAYDNLKSAVIKVIGRERSLNKKFLELRSHYLFLTRFCNVARGNEKGHTENSVKRSQSNYLTPPPSVTAIDQLNKHLFERCESDLQRFDKATQLTYGQLFEQERQVFAQLPQTRFHACVQRAARVDRYATVQHEETRYSVPCRYACLHSVIRVGCELVEVIVDNQIVATHDRGTPGQWVLKMEHYLPVLQRKPGLLDSGKPFVKANFTDSELLLRRELEYRYNEDGTRQFLDVLLLSREFEFSLVRTAIDNCVCARAFHEGAIRLELQRLTATSRDQPATILDLTNRPNLETEITGTRDLSVYDALMPGNAATTNDLSVSLPLLA